MRKASENCKGCGNLTTHCHEQLCFFTKAYTPEFLDCVCQTCLVKILCHNHCDAFCEMLKQQDSPWRKMTLAQIDSVRRSLKREINGEYEFL